MQTHTKLTTGLAVFAIAGWFCFWAKSTTPPVTVEKIVTQEVVKYVDRVVTKDSVRTETRPDGTKIVTETKSNETDKSVTKEKSNERIVTKPLLSKYSLGVSITPHMDIRDFRPSFDYGAEVGARLWSSPVFVTLAYNTKHEITLGLRIEL